MITRDLTTIDMEDSWQEQDPSLRWRVQFPLMGEPGTESLGTVYIEIEPGDALPMHTDSRDEMVVVLNGSGEGTVGDETVPLNTGSMVFVPAMTPHGFRNTGSGTLRLLGVFAGADVVSTFEDVVMPEGLRVFGEEDAVPAS